MKPIRCAWCGQEFMPTNSDDDAMAECEQYFGKVRPDEISVICDICFQKIHPENHPHKVEEAVAENIRERKTP